ncbi:MAG: hypothetical protein ACTSYD_02355 [Candidatus Heimdallarchaeaceae archaeon]
MGFEELVFLEILEMLLCVVFVYWIISTLYVLLSVGICFIYNANTKLEKLKFTLIVLALSWLIFPNIIITQLTVAIRNRNNKEKIYSTNRR